MTAGRCLAGRPPACQAAQPAPSPSHLLSRPAPIPRQPAPSPAPRPAVRLTRGPPVCWDCRHASPPPTKPLPPLPRPSPAPAPGPAVRLPEGRRLQRRFPSDATVAALYDLCLSESAEAAGGRAFLLAPAAPGAPRAPRRACWRAGGADARPGRCMPCRAGARSGPSDCCSRTASPATACTPPLQSPPAFTPAHPPLAHCPLQAPPRWRTGSRGCRRRGCPAPC